MRFANVNDAKLGDVFVFMIHLFHFAQLGAKGRSRVAAEEKHHGLFASEALQIRDAFAIEGVDFESWRNFTAFRRAVVPAPPRAWRLRLVEPHGINRGFLHNFSCRGLAFRT